MIKLTNEHGNEVWINPRYIVGMVPVDGGTELSLSTDARLLSGGSFGMLVQETPAWIQLEIHKWTVG